jgi:hypothetical protein
MQCVFMQTSVIQFKVIHIRFLPTLFLGTGSQRPSKGTDLLPSPFSLSATTAANIPLHTTQSNGSHAIRRFNFQHHSRHGVKATWKKLFCTACLPAGSTVQQRANPCQATHQSWIQRLQQQPLASQKTPPTAPHTLNTLGNARTA